MRSTAPVALLCVVCHLGACATIPAKDEPKRYWMDAHGVVVTGPWDAVPPSDSFDEVIDKLCPSILSLPLATERQYGQEYCGAIYKTEDDKWWVSNMSPLGPTRTRRLSWDLRSSESALDRAQPSQSAAACYPPYKVIDARKVELFVEADVHNHPWPSELSPGDMRDANQLWRIRVQLTADCRIYKYEPGVTNKDEGKVYRWLGRAKGWDQIGVVKAGEDRAVGRFTALPGKGW